MTTCAFTAWAARPRIVPRFWKLPLRSGRRPELSLGLALVRATNLSRRLAWIDVSRGKSRCLLGLPCAVGRDAVAAMLFARCSGLDRARTSGGLGRAEERRRREEAPRGWAARCDRSRGRGQGLGKATAGRDGPLLDRFRARLIRKADRDGVVRFDLMRRKFQDTLSLDVWAEGYVQQRYFFAQNDARYPKIPDSISPWICCPARRHWAARSRMSRGGRSLA